VVSGSSVTTVVTVPGTLIESESGTVFDKVFTSSLPPEPTGEGGSEQNPNDPNDTGATATNVVGQGASGIVRVTGNSTVSPAPRIPSATLELTLFRADKS